MLDATTEGGSERQLREEEVAWLTTVRPDGQPQSVSIWFLWDGETFLIYSQRGRQKLKKYRAAIAGIGYDPDGFARDYSVPIRVTP